MKNIIQSKSVNKIFNLGKDNNYQALNNVDLTIQAGEFVSIMGPSGSGKSTLLYNMSGMDKVTSGEVLFDGRDLSLMSEQELSDLRLTKMGFIFQQFNLLSNLSIFDNIVVTAYLKNQVDRATIDARAQELMSQMGISTIKNRNITQASGGQLQRVAICRALINQPDIIFGDEPTGALNSKSAQTIMEILVEINQQLKTAIFIATHDAKVALKSERVIYLIDGKIASEIKLGKYLNNNDKQNREARLTEWLNNLGF